MITMTPTAGLGFKPQHFSEALASPAVGLWFEVHAENYMVDGGRASRCSRPFAASASFRFTASDCRSEAQRAGR